MSVKKGIRADKTYLFPHCKGDNPVLGAKILSDGRESLFLDYYFENEDQEVFFSPIVQRKVKKEEYFGFDFDSFDEVVENRRLAESLEEVLKRYREATPMLPCF